MSKVRYRGTCYCEELESLCYSCADHIRGKGFRVISLPAVEELRLVSSLNLTELEEVAEIKKSVQIETLYGTG